MPGSPDLMEGFTAIDRAAPAYRLADQYATGALPERFTTRKIAEKLKGSGDAYRFRLSRKPITSLTNRVGISAITSSAGSQVDKRIELIRKANDMEIQEPFLIDRAATYGDAYLFVWPVEPDESDEIDTPAEKLLREAGVELSYQSPLNCRAMYDTEDGRRCRYVVRRWQEKWALGTVWRAEVFYLGRIEAWVSDPDATGTDPNQWHPYAEDESGEPVPVTDENWPIMYEAGQIAIRHFRTALPYGRPQHADAYGPQDAITKGIVTQVEVDLEAHGYPERAKIVDESAAQDTARDAVPWTNDGQAPAVARQTKQPGGPGTMTTHRATKSIVQFPTPDPTELVTPLEFWVRLMATATDTPLWEFDPSAGMSMSGYARYLAEAPLRAREKAFKRYLLAFVRETYTLALELVGIEAGDLDVSWTPPEVTSDPEWWGTATIRREHGVPQEEILAEAGYEPNKIAEFLDPKSDERFWGERVKLLKDLSEALNALSGPVSLGIVDAAKVSALVDKIMAEAGDGAIGGDGEKDEPEPVAVLPSTPVDKPVEAA